MATGAAASHRPCGSCHRYLPLVGRARLARRGLWSAPLSVDQALRIFEPICHGVAAAHERGIVHWDLKPGNVMLERGGRVVVTDFGMARRGEDGDRLTMGQVLGTPAYMAPEQVMATTVEPPADVYALGLILFEMLTGRPAGRGPSPVMVAAMRTMEDAPRLQVLRPDVGAEVSDLVARCLNRAAEDRFSDAGALLRALADLRGATSSTSSQPSFGAATRRTRTVAVLPFRNLGGEESHAAAIGLAEDLVDVLSMTDGLRVRHGASADVCFGSEHWQCWTIYRGLPVPYGSTDFDAPKEEEDKIAFAGEHTRVPDGRDPVANEDLVQNVPDHRGDPTKTLSTIDSSKSSRPSTHLEASYARDDLYVRSNPMSTRSSSVGMCFAFALLAACEGPLGADDEAGADTDAGGETSADSIMLGGAVQKGPLLLGSSVDVSTLDPTGKPTGVVYGTRTINDLGEFWVSIPKSAPVSIEASGYYYNEVSGGLSTSWITLLAIYNADKNETNPILINTITHLT